MNMVEQHAFRNHMSKFDALVELHGLGLINANVWPDVPDEESAESKPEPRFRHLAGVK